MIIGDFINKNYDYVSYRVILDDWCENNNYTKKEIYEHSTFAGSFKIENNKIIPLDGDTYLEDEEVIWYEEWNTKDIKSGLTIVVKVNWLSG